MGRTKFSVVLIVVCVVKCLAMPYDELEDFAEHIKKTSQLSPTLKKGADPDDDYDEEETVSDHAWEDSGKFEGDLILNERQRRLIVEDVAEGLSRNGIRDGTKRWPNNEVTYYIQVEHFTGDQVQAIESGIQDIAGASCVKFRRYRKGDRDAVVIQGSRRGCFSQVGYQGGYQVLNLSGRHPVGRGCFRHGTVVHELLHTLGFYHMQSSPDRDDYVNIVWANIVQPARHNFRKYNSFSVSDFGVGYDYDSVLHYSRRAFSANGQDTIVPKQSGAQIGQRAGLSEKDTQKLNKMYCDADSDNGQADETTSSKTGTKKKNGRNKPFEGHGIGYHQGKAVAIKLLPAAETYKLPDVPSFHVFDYFSKEPQILSPSESEGFRIGKEIAYSYGPSDVLTTQENKTPISLNSGLKIKPDYNEIKLQTQNNQEHIGDQINQLKNTNSDITHEFNNPKSEKTDADLADAFDRLSKILKQHVYPSQTPNLSIYRPVEHYIDNTHSPEIKQESDKLFSPGPIRGEESEDNKTNFAVSIINNLYDLSLDKSVSENVHDGKSEKYENEQKRKKIKEVEHDNVDDKKYISSHKINSFPLHKLYEDEYVSSYLPEHYEDGTEYTSIYSPKLQTKEKSSKNQNEWYQNYTPYYPSRKYYTDYESNDSSHGPKRDEKENENVYSSSIPIKSHDYSISNIPASVNHDWYKIKHK